ncbi:hypothetical protein ACWECC_33140 [Streptomyces microflavus]
MTEITARTYTADAIAAGLSTYPYPEPALDTSALAQAIGVQLATWVGATFGLAAPTAQALADRPLESITRFLGELTAHVHLHGVEVEGDAGPWGVAHLFTARAAALDAGRGSEDAPLLGVLYSCITARAHLRDGHEGHLALDPFGEDQHALTEKALIETVRVQLATWVPDTFGTIVQIPGRSAMRHAADLSDVLGDVLGAGEAKYGDMEDDSSIRGMAHLANARTHGLKAGYGHGDAHVFAALGSLVLAAANLA